MSDALLIRMLYVVVLLVFSGVTYFFRSVCLTDDTEVNIFSDLV